MRQKINGTFLMIAVIQKYPSTRSMRRSLHTKKSSSLSLSIIFFSILACSSKYDRCQILFKNENAVFYYCFLLAWVMPIGTYALMIWKVGDKNKDDPTLKLQIREPQCFSKVQMQKRIYFFIAGGKFCSLLPEKIQFHWLKIMQKFALRSPRQLWEGKK